MLTVYRLVLGLHVALGALALAAFWIALAARKGSPRHLRAGRTYVVSMSGCAALAVTLGVLTLVDPRGTHPPGADWSAADLARHAEVVGELLPSIGFTGLIVLSLVHFGWRAPARAGVCSAGARALDWAVPGALLAAGLSGIAIGRVPRLEFADGMGVACVLFALPQLASLARGGRARPWIVAHLAGLGCAAVIGHVALFVSILPRIAPELWSRDPAVNPTVWLVSPVVGSVLLAGGCVHWSCRPARRTGLAHRARLAPPRIQPHSNCLNTVASLIEEDPKRAEAAVEKLSDLYRHALAASQRRLVPLREELEAVAGFLELESLRYGERLRFRLDVAPDLGQVPVPPLVLQPLVENAVLHGITRRREGGRIQVGVARRGARLELRVEDDGPGAAGSEHRGSGTALRDLSERLGLLYAGDATLERDASPFGGYRVRISIPLAPAREAP